MKILSAFTYSRLCGGICGVSCSNLSRGTCCLDREFLFSSLYLPAVWVVFVIIFQSDLAQIKCVRDLWSAVQKERLHGTGDVHATDNIKTLLSRPVCSSNTVAKYLSRQPQSSLKSAPKNKFRWSFDIRRHRVTCESRNGSKHLICAEKEFGFFHYFAVA